MRSRAALLVTALTACGDSGADADATASSATSVSSTATTSTSAGGGTTTGSVGGGGATGTGGGIGAGGQGSGGGFAQGCGNGSTPTGSGTFRVVAANLTSENAQSYDPGHGIRILEGIHGDILLLQELNYGDSEVTSLCSFTDQVCGPECEMVRGTGTLPNGIVSRFPILDGGSVPDPSVTNRDFVWARLDVPGSVDLYAFSVHLLTSGASARNAEAVALSAEIASLVPAAALLVIGGDLNTDARDEAALVTLSQNVVVGAPWPVDQAAIDLTNQPRTKPYDWLLADPDLDALMVPTSFGANSFSSGLVVDTRVYSPLSDLAPALVTDSGATGMQHMAIAKDYFVP